MIQSNPWAHKNDLILTKAEFRGKCNQNASENIQSSPISLKNATALCEKPIAFFGVEG